MKQRRNKRQRRPRQITAPQSGRAGFTLIEVMVVIAVLGALTAAISVNWASFIRHQELRQDAITLHKEIMALKARAIENGYEASLRVTSDSCKIMWLVSTPTDAAPESTTPVTKDINLNNGVIIGIGSDMTPLGDIPTDISDTDNKWKSTISGTVVEIKAQPDNLKAYDGLGRIVVSSGKAKARYCIQKDDTGIRPELYHQSKSGAQWTRM